MRTHVLGVTLCAIETVHEGPLSLLLPLVWSIFIRSPFESAQRRLTAEDLFSFCEHQPAWCAGEVLFFSLFFFTPNYCYCGKASVKKYSWFQKKVIKVKVFKKKKLLSYFQSAAATIVRVRGPGSQLASLKWEWRTRRSTQESGWIPRQNLLII